MHDVNAVMESGAFRMTCGVCKKSLLVSIEGMQWVDGFNQFIERHRHPELIPTSRMLSDSDSDIVRQAD